MAKAISVRLDDEAERALNALEATGLIEVAGGTTRVLVEQLGAVDAQRLGDRIHLLSPEEMWAVDDALVTVLRLN
jgi:mRNA-degrading endonuclease toxin of MazEF toxin-antitoxin module